MKTILEFSEEQQSIHYNSVIDNLPQSKENSNGFKTLIVCENKYEASAFSYFLQVQYLSKGFTKFSVLKNTIDNLTKFIPIYLNKKSEEN